MRHLFVSLLAHCGAAWRARVGGCLCFWSSLSGGSSTPEHSRHKAPSSALELPGSPLKQSTPAHQRAAGSIQAAKRRRLDKRATAASPRGTLVRPSSHTRVAQEVQTVRRRASESLLAHSGRCHQEPQSLQERPQGKNLTAPRATAGAHSWRAVPMTSLVQQQRSLQTLFASSGRPREVCLVERCARNMKTCARSQQRLRPSPARLQSQPLA